MLAALVRPIFNADSGEQARELVGEALKRPLPKIAAMPERGEEDLLAFYAFPVDHRRKPRSTNPLERLNREIGRRTDVVGIFPDARFLSRRRSRSCATERRPAPMRSSYSTTATSPGRAKRHAPLHHPQPRW